MISPETRSIECTVLAGFIHISTIGLTTLRTNLSVQTQALTQLHQRSFLSLLHSAVLLAHAVRTKAWHMLLP